MRPLRILTWHVHGSYLNYLSFCPHDFFLPVKPDRPEGYGGRCGTLPWRSNVHEIAAEEVRHSSFDCVLFQSRKNYLEDQYEILGSEQRALPRIYLEHDPPREHPTDTRHPVDDPSVLVVHVTHFNQLMWNSNGTPTMVIDHGVCVPPTVRYEGSLPRGLVIVNGLPSRGRRLGLDIVERVRNAIPLDIVGLQSAEAGGLGEVPWHSLPDLEIQYRFLFNPIRYTSLGLAVCEAMMLGVPIIGLATTEMSTTIVNGVSGYVGTDIDWLIEKMRLLLDDPAHAAKLGAGARAAAECRFNIERFTKDWERAFSQALGRRAAPYHSAADRYEHHAS